jgi:hypothetical protein
MNESQNGWLVLILLLLVGYLSFFHTQKYEEKSAEEWHEEYSYCSTDLRSYKRALEEANINIEEAQYYSEESYEDMSDALENLETVEP